MTFLLCDGTAVSPSIPFFITGSGRCGTTLLRRLLIEKSGAVIPPENYSLGISGRLSPLIRADYRQYCLSILDEMRSNNDQGWSWYGIDTHQALELLSSVPAEHRSVANFWHAFHALYAIAVGKPSVTRWGDKTPLNVWRLDHINQIFATARFVFMIRNVFDASYSYGNMDIQGRHGQYLDGARRWVDSNRKLLDFAQRHPEKVKLVRYEDLVTDPDGIVDVLLDFLDLTRVAGQAINTAESRDIETIAHLQNALGEVRSDYIGKSNDKLPMEVRLEIREIAADLSRSLGYDPD